MNSLSTFTALWTKRKFTTRKDFPTRRISRGEKPKKFTKKIQKKENRKKGKTWSTETHVKLQKKNFLKFFFRIFIPSPTLTMSSTLSSGSLVNFNMLYNRHPKSVWRPEEKNGENFFLKISEKNISRQLHVLQLRLCVEIYVTSPQMS